MGDLTIKNNEKILAPIKFVKIAETSVKIANLTQNEFDCDIKITMAQVLPYLGIKNKVEIYQSEDVKKMLLRRFKHLSLIEIVRAFENERYGVYEKKTEHFQEFSADYVANVLKKYEDWKKLIRKNNNLHLKKAEETMTEEEKKKWTREAVFNQLEYFITNRCVDKTRLYVYQTFYEMNLLPKDPEYKRSVHKDAIELLKQEYANKKAISIEQHKEIKHIAEGLNIKNKTPKVILKCHELALEDFFRKLTRNQEEIQNFKNLFE